MNLDIIIYLAVLAIVYFYPNRKGSVAFFWISFYVLLHWLLTEAFEVNVAIASIAIGTALLAAFEVSYRFWEDPFSEAKVVQGFHGLLDGLGALLSRFGIKPKVSLVDHKESENVVRINRLLSESQWDELEQLLKSLPANERYHVVQTVVEVKGRPKPLDLWLEHRPRSVMAHIVSGHHLIKWAWEARGSGVASTVTNEGIEHFFQRLFLAKDTLEKAIKLENKYADPYVGLITIAMGTGVERDQLWEYFAKALLHTKDHYYAHTSMINALAEKWGGDEHEMFSVAYKASFNAKDNSPLAGIIAVAHVEQWLYLHMCDLDEEADAYFKQQKVRQGLLDAYKKIAGCSLESNEHVEALNVFAFCFYHAGLYPIAKEVVEKLGPNFVEYPWIYCGEPFLATFDTAFAVEHVLNKLDKTNVENGLSMPSDGFAAKNGAAKGESAKEEAAKDENSKEAAKKEAADNQIESNPYVAPKDTNPRVFKTPIIAPLSVVMVILMYAGYSFLHLMGTSANLLNDLKGISFEVFLMCEVGIVALILVNKGNLEKFLTAHPMIKNQASLEALKPIVRTNMYSALIMFFFMGLGALTAIMTIIHYGLIESSVVVVLSLFASYLVNRYNTYEQQIKQIECEDEELELELTKILDSWMHKAFPDF